MKQKRPGASSHPREVLLPEYWRPRLLPFALTEARWKKIRANIPDQLAPEADARLRADINRCCFSFLASCQALRDGGVTADALRSRGGGEPSPLERLAKSLRKAADAWAEISGNPPRPTFAEWLDRLHAEPRIKDVKPWEDHDFRWPYDIGVTPAEAVDLAIKVDAFGNNRPSAIARNMRDITSPRSPSQSEAVACTTASYALAPSLRMSAGAARSRLPA